MLKLATNNHIPFFVMLEMPFYPGIDQEILPKSQLHHTKYRSPQSYQYPCNPDMFYLELLAPWNCNKYVTQ